ncbi:hypothetical protein EK21DRAFT_35689, partial [Setomelanomma holmii]
DLSHPSEAQPQNFSCPHGLTLQVNFAWSKFRNIVSTKSPSGSLTPLYIQHFRPTKPNLRIEDASSGAEIATGTIHAVRVSAETTVNGNTLHLKPVSRWATHYNYLSPALGSQQVEWITTVSAKIWDFVCLDSYQLPVAKFSVNLWAVKQVGNFHFEKNAEEVGKEVRDEVVAAELTILYTM